MSTHDAKCELTLRTPRFFATPQPGECWCAERADGYEYWGNVGGAGNHLLSRGDNLTPPNMLGDVAS